MEKELTSDGFSVARNVLDGADIETLRGAINDTMDRVARALLTPFEHSHPELPFEERLERVARENRAYALALYQAVMADAQADPRVKALTDHPRLSALVNSLLAPLAATGHVLRTRASIPMLSSACTAWHQDVVRPSHSGCGSTKLACWIPLSDVDEETGALEVIPGKWQPLPHQSNDPDGRLRIADQDLPKSPSRIVPVRRGDVLVMDRFLPHRALPARGERVRWTVVMWVQSACQMGTC
ncbi:MAG: phytanoyl-CoA dioxygenase family protein [Elusimicrobia bacterium]|nr:phytanoyl-CoA dioxygenase family protein [Elusimicrobiota bacterium]